LQEKEALQENIYARLPGKLEFASDGPANKPDVSLFDLINAVSSILKRINEREPVRDVYEDKWTVSEKMEHLLSLTKDRPRLRFSELFADNTSRLEVVVTFLAVLELIRLKVLTVTQPEPFSEIEIGMATPPVVAPQAAAAAAPAGSSSVS
jgi:segregation and condensation protein A